MASIARAGSAALEATNDGFAGASGKAPVVEMLRNAKVFIGGDVPLWERFYRDGSATCLSR